MYLWKNDDAVSIELAFSTEKEMISNLFNNVFDTTAMKNDFLTSRRLEMMLPCLIRSNFFNPPKIRVKHQKTTKSPNSRRYELKSFSSSIPSLIASLWPDLVAEKYFNMS